MINARQRPSPIHMTYGRNPSGSKEEKVDGSLAFVIIQND